MKHLSVHEYLAYPETMRPMELVYGVVREPPAPFLRHQVVVFRMASALHDHVQRQGLGDVYMSPVDVVLDRERALVLQPDIVFIAAERSHIATDRIWGAPDLVVEVLSPGTERRDRTQKVAWYREYGVRECWLVDVTRRRIEVIHTRAQRRSPRAICSDQQPLRSIILPDLELVAGTLFD